MAFSIARKLIRMGPREVTGRLRGEADVVRLKWWSRNPAKLTRQIRCTPREVINRCLNIVPGASRAELDRASEKYPDAYSEAKAFSNNTGKQLLSGQFKFLGETLSLSSEMDWHSDPITGFRWSDEFFSDVSYNRIPDHVDFKYIWELGRQQYVVDLARAWQLSGNEAYGQAARDMMLSWIEANPFCHGIHWTSGLEVGVRAISWIWALAHLSDYSEWENGDQQRIIESLAMHACYLEHHFSYYSSPYNHIIGEASGLYLIANVLQGNALATRWRNKAAKVLNSFGPKQFYRDGFCVEQAMGYHYFTLGFLILAQLADRQFDDQCLCLEETLYTAFNAGKNFQQPDGCWPVIGDVDSAISIPVTREEYWDFTSLHHVAAMVLDKTAILPMRAGLTLSLNDAYWLQGADALDPMWSDNSEVDHFGVLESSGYLVAAKSGDFLLFDSGSVAHGLHHDSVSSVAHGHADTLQVLYHLRGKPLLIDSGMPNYAGNKARAKFFRSPNAHNTVSIDGAPFVRSAGTLSWSNEVNCPTLTGNADELGRWTAMGHVCWPHCQIYRFLLALPGEAIWIADWILTEKVTTATWFWQFLNESGISLQNSVSEILASGDDGISIRVGSSAALHDPVLTVGGSNKTAGWVSRGYGQLSSSRRLSYAGRVSDRMLVVTCIGDPQRSVVAEIDGISVSVGKSDVELQHSKPRSLWMTGEVSGRWIINECL